MFPRHFRRKPCRSGSASCGRPSTVGSSEKRRSPRYRFARFQMQHNQRVFHQGEGAMRFVKSLFVVLAAVFAIAVAREARAQQFDPYVSCVKCHALPMQQASAQMQRRTATSIPRRPSKPAPTATTRGCTSRIRLRPRSLPYFLCSAGNGPGSPLANACLSCHSTSPVPAITPTTCPRILTRPRRRTRRCGPRVRPPSCRSSTSYGDARPVPYSAASSAPPATTRTTPPTP